MRRVSLDEAKAQLSDLVDAAVNGEDVLIAGGDQRIVRLVPVDRPKRRPRFGSARGLVKMADDFDDPLPDFREYME